MRIMDFGHPLIYQYMNFRLFYQGYSDLTTLTSIFLLMGSFENLSEQHWSPSEFANYNS